MGGKKRQQVTVNLHYLGNAKFVGVVLGLLLLGIKGELLNKIDDATKDSSGSDSETTIVDKTGRSQSPVFELADIHTSSDITIMNNPMHNIEEGAILAAA